MADSGNPWLDDALLSTEEPIAAHRSTQTEDAAAAALGSTETDPLVVPAGGMADANAAGMGPDPQSHESGRSDAAAALGSTETDPPAVPAGDVADTNAAGPGAGARRDAQALESLFSAAGAAVLAEPSIARHASAVDPLWRCIRTLREHPELARDLAVMRLAYALEAHIDGSRDVQEISSAVEAAFVAVRTALHLTRRAAPYDEQRPGRTDLGPSPSYVRHSLAGSGRTASFRPHSGSY
jgi:hypothetical protein